MSGPRFERLLASTALALILAAPTGAIAQEGSAPTAPAPSAQHVAETAARSGGRGKTSGAGATPKEAPAAPTTPVVAGEQTPDPLATLDPADRAVAEKIRDLLAAKTDKIFANKRERAAVESFYQARHLAPLWLDKGIENARAQAVIERLKAADADGLEVSDYKTPTFAGLPPDALAEAELKLTQTVLTYARHLQA